MTETTAADAAPDAVAKKPKSVFAIFETDIDHAENGKWFNDFAGTGIDFKVGRFSSKRSQAARLLAEEHYRKELGIKNGLLPPEVQEKIQIEQMAGGVVRDWRNCYDDDGAEIAYSTEKARELLTRLPELRLALAGTAFDLDNFRKETREAVLGN